MANPWGHISAVGRRALACARRHLLAFFVVELALAAACSTVLADDVGVSLLARDFVLAVLGLAAAGLAREGALAGRPVDQALDRRGSGRAARSGQREDGPSAPGRPQAFWAAYGLVIGLVGGLAGLVANELGASGAAAGAAASASGGAVLVGAIVLMCALTGIFEEGVFRVAAVEAFEAAFGDDARAPLKAAALSAVVFGLLHVSVADAAAAQSAVAAAQFVLKPVQAALFGFCLAVAYQRMRSLWPLAVFHALFDLLYLGPTMAATGALSLAYVTGQPADLAVLTLTTALLVPPAVAAARAAQRSEAVSSR